MSITSVKTYTKIGIYLRSPLWWRYERRRLALPLQLRRMTDRIFRVYEFWRVSQGVTRVLGPRFSRSRRKMRSQDHF